MLPFLLATTFSVLVNQGEAIGASCSAHLLRHASLETRDLEKETPSTWTWHLRSDEFVICKAAGFEPRVVVAEELPLETPLELHPGQPVSIVGATEGMLIEGWRETEDGIRRVALWSLRDSEKPSLTISPETQVVRVLRPNSSPVTLFREKDKSEEEKIVVPPSVRGGELAGKIIRRRFEPIAANVRCNDDVASSRVVEGWFSVPGLKPGRCEVNFVFIGGVQSDGIPIEVRDQHTTELYGLDLVVGALSIDIDTEVCRRPSKTIGLRIDKQEGQTQTSFIQQPIAPDGCLLYFEGVPPGHYHVGVYDPGERQRRDQKALEGANVQVHAWRLESVKLESFPVRISGSIQVGGSPIRRRMFVEFRDENNNWLLETDETGSFSMSLPTPGTYDIVIRATRYFPVATFSRHFDVGHQNSLFEIGGGAIFVRVLDDAGEPVDDILQVVLQAPSGIKAGPMLPGEEELAFWGLAFETYTIRVRGIGGLVSKSDVVVELTETSPTALVNVHVTSGAGRLILADERGQPLEGASVRAGSTILDEQSPGAFPLDEVPIGELIEIRSPGAPTICRRRAKGDTTVIQSRGPFSARLAISKGLTQRGIGHLAGVPASDCPIPLYQFVISSDDDHVVVEVPGLFAGIYQYTHPALSSPISLTLPSDLIRVP